MARSSRRSKPYLLLSTASSPKEAKKIARALVQQKAAACVNLISQVHSFFKWHGAIDQAHELLLIVKTDLRRLKQAERIIRKHHSYEIPEMIAWPIAWGHHPYLKWLTDSVAPDS